MVLYFTKESIFNKRNELSTVKPFIHTLLSKIIIPFIFYLLLIINAAKFILSYQQKMSYFCGVNNITFYDERRDDFTLKQHVTRHDVTRHEFQ